MGMISIEKVIFDNLTSVAQELLHYFDTGSNPHHNITFLYHHQKAIGTFAINYYASN